MNEHEAKWTAGEVLWLEARVESGVLSRPDELAAHGRAFLLRTQLGEAGWRMTSDGEVVRASVGAHSFGVRL